MVIRHSAHRGRCLGVLLLLVASCCIGVTAIGVNYGTVADDLPTPDQVVKLVQSTYISQVKIYSTDPTILSAFANSGISLVVSTTNDEISPIAASESFAQQWITSNVASHYPSTDIVCIVVGNEVLTSAPNSSYDLLPAMQNLHTGLTNLGLDDKIKVSTPHSYGVMGTSYPPSIGAFRADLSTPIFSPMLDFLSQTGAPFMINAYPYFAFREDPNISLAYALFEPTTVVLDSASGLSYKNLFDAQVDATYAAIAKLGHTDITVIVSETGWPSYGDADEVGVGLTNAQSYVSNLLQHVNTNDGTPGKPNAPVDTYIFALFNENQKPGPSSERNFGLFQPDQSVVYNVGLVTGNTTGTSSPPPPPTAPTNPSPPSPAAQSPESPPAYSPESPPAYSPESPPAFSPESPPAFTPESPPAFTPESPPAFTPESPPAFTPESPPAYSPESPPAFTQPPPALPPPPPAFSPESPPAFSPESPPAPPAFAQPPPAFPQPPPAYSPEPAPPTQPPPAFAQPPPAFPQPPPAFTPSAPPTESPIAPSPFSSTPPPPFTAPPPPYPVPHVPPTTGTSPPPPPATTTAPPPPPATSSYPPPATSTPPPPSFFSPPPGSTTAPSPAGTPPFFPSPSPYPVTPSPESPPPPAPAAPSPESPPPPAPPAPVTPSPVSPSPPAPAAPSPESPPPPTTPETPSPAGGGAPPGTPPAPPGTASGPNTWCVAKPGSPATDMANALNYACGEGGADCTQIQTGAACFNPDTLFSHASYAFSSYYALNGRNYWNCFFGNSSLITITNPSYAGCEFP